MRKLSICLPPVDHPGAQLTCGVVSGDEVSGERRVTKIIRKSFLHGWLGASAANQQDPRLGTWDRERVSPGKSRKNGSGLMKLGCADQQGEAACGSEQAGGDRKDVGEALHGTQGHQVEGGLGREGLGAAGMYIDI